MWTNDELRETILKHGNKTPFFLYKRDVIRKRIKKIRDAFSGYDNFQLFYAVKANHSDIILEEIKKAGVGAAVSSPEELKKIQRCRIEPISYTAPFTSEQILEKAARRETELNFNNHSEVANSKKNNIGVRINPEVGWPYFREYRAASKNSQFGIPYKQALKSDLSKVSRLHMHTSSDSYKINTFIKALRRMLVVAEKFPGIDTLNVGGGMAVPLGKDEEEFDINLYARKIIQTVEKFNTENGRRLKIQIEPGSYIVRPAAYYVCRIQAKDKKNKRLFCFVDGTKHHLKGLDNVEKMDFVTKADKKIKAAICGCTCQKSDVISSNTKIPDLNIGDLVVIPMAGAYCLVQSDNFHLLETPKEVVTDQLKK